MPSFAAAYSDAEIAAVSNYVIGHFGGKQGKVTAAEVRAPPRLRLIAALPAWKLTNEASRIRVELKLHNGEWPWKSR